VGQSELETAAQVKYLADLYVGLALYDKVEPLLLRSLRIYEMKLGPFTAPHALNLMELAVLYKRQGKTEKAQKFRDEMIIALQKLEEGKEAKDSRIALGKLADFFFLQDRLDEADLVFRYALLNSEEQEFPKHTFMAESLLGLARLFAESANWTESAGQYHRAIDCWTRIHTAEAPEMLATCLSECAEVLHRVDKHDEADLLEQRLASLAK
jgi:tetratricopeptide (TPR) repeat protein